MDVAFIIEHSRKGAKPFNFRCSFDVMSFHLYHNNLFTAIPQESCIDSKKFSNILQIIFKVKGNNKKS